LLHCYRGRLSALGGARVTNHNFERQEVSFPHPCKTSRGTMNATLRAPLQLRRPAYHVVCRQQQRIKSTLPKQSVELGGEQGSSWFKRAWGRYCEALLARPLIVKATAASLIFFTSDSATQYLIDSTAEWDGARAGSGAAFGVIATTWLHYWWGFLEGFVGARLPVAQYRLSNTLVKVVVDQAIGAPLYIYTYYVVTNFLQELNSQPQTDGKSASVLLNETHHKASQMLMPTMMRHWILWPAVHSLNFYYMPLHHRVLVQNLVLVGWSGCKSWIVDSDPWMWCVLPIRC
jgi:protein Mpv17